MSYLETCTDYHTVTTIISRQSHNFTATGYHIGTKPPSYRYRISYGQESQSYRDKIKYRNNSLPHCYKISYRHFHRGIMSRDATFATVYLQ